MGLHRLTVLRRNGGLGHNGLSLRHCRRSLGKHLLGAGLSLRNRPGNCLLCPWYGHIGHGLCLLSGFASKQTESFFLFSLGCCWGWLWPWRYRRRRSARHGALIHGGILHRYCATVHSHVLHWYTAPVRNRVLHRYTTLVHSRILHRYTALVHDRVLRGYSTLGRGCSLGDSGILCRDSALGVDDVLIGYIILHWFNKLRGSLPLCGNRCLLWLLSGILRTCLQPFQQCLEILQQKTCRIVQPVNNLPHIVGVLRSIKLSGKHNAFKQHSHIRHVLYQTHHRHTDHGYFQSTDIDKYLFRIIEKTASVQHIIVRIPQGVTDTQKHACQSAAIDGSLQQLF